MTTPTCFNSNSILIVTLLCANYLSPTSCFVHQRLGSEVRAFTAIHHQRNNLHQQSQSQSKSQSFTQIKSSNNEGDKDDEIAELEAKLAKLKQEKEVEATNAVATATAPATATSDDEFVPKTQLNGDRVEDLAPLDEMLSESWKESNVDNNGGESSGVGGIVTSLATILALIIGFVLLGQVPVGQDGLDKYSTAKPSTTIDLGDKNPAAKVSDLY
jgi:hypothetical protein